MVAEAPVAISAPEGNVAPPLEITTPEVAEPVAEAAEAAPEAEVEAPKPRDITDLSDDELASHERVQGIIRRREQSARDKATVEEKRRSDAALQQYVARGEYAEELAQAYTVDDMGSVQPDRKRIGDVVGKLQTALASQTSAQAYQALNSMLPYEGMPQETRERIASAGTEWMASYLDAIAESKAESLLPEKQKQWETEYRKQQQARQTVAEREAASAARQQAGATAGLVGGAPNQFTSKREIDRAHMDGEITTAQLREWRDSGRYAALPF